MSSKNIIEHPFYTYGELINRLKKNGLLIVDESKLLKYLKSFNYENVINGYKSPFLTNDKFNTYVLHSNSQMILDLFDFDRVISAILISDLHAIEMKLSSAIAYELMKIINELHPNRTAFSSLTTIELQKIFSSNSKRIDELETKFQQNFDEISKNKEYINTEWTKWQDVPLYSLALLLNFGNSIRLFANLNSEIQQRILTNYFYTIKDINLKTFMSLMYCFKELRNKLSHNAPIYLFKYELNQLIYRIRLIYTSISRKEIKKVIENDFLNFLCENSNPKNSFKLFNMIKIIAKITENKKLVNIAEAKIKKLELAIAGTFIKIETTNQVFLPCEEAWKNIRNFLGYDED